MRHNSIGIAFLAVVRVCLATASFAGERYYVPPHADDVQTQLLDDQPVTLALARCYGRYDSIGRVGDNYIRDKTIAFPSPPDAPEEMKETGTVLLAAASRERNERLSLATLTPERFDDAGQVIATGAPAEIYDVYLRGLSDIAWGFNDQVWQKSARERADILRAALPALLGSCRALQASITANRDTGPPREPLYDRSADPFLKGLPRVLALARCLGRYSYMRSDYDNAARKPGSDYPNRFIDEWNSLTHLLAYFARRDRGVVLTFSGGAALPAFPPAIADAVHAGAGDGYDIDFRPDFWSLPSDVEIKAIDYGSKADRAACQSAMYALKAPS